MQVTIGSGIAGGCATFFAWAGALAGFILFLIYGIFALVAQGPFQHQDLATGITLIVLACVGIAGLAGAIAGALVGCCIGLPFMCCDGESSLV